MSNIESSMASIQARVDALSAQAHGLELMRLAGVAAMKSKGLMEMFEEGKEAEMVRLDAGAIAGVWSKAINAEQLQEGF